MKQGRFQSMLRRALGHPVQMILNDNTHVFLNAHFKKRRWVVRLHWMFLKAPKEMPRHIARYILARNRRSSKIIDRFIERHWDWVRHPLPPIRTQGKYFDLQKIMNLLNRKYLKGKVSAHITWGTAGRRSYEQLQMGSYSTSRNLITIHPHLDQKFVPKYVVEATIFHEMCHALVPVREVKGRKQIHPPLFKKLEAEYPHLAKAQHWEEKYLDSLLRAINKKPHFSNLSRGVF